MTYSQLLAALCLWREARNQPLPVLRAIWHVILNRASDENKRWPNSIVQVILQPHQFSSFNPNDPNATLFPTDTRLADWRAFQTCMDVVSDSLASDPTKGATNYENCNQDSLPGWADETKITARIGPFRFYKL